MAAVSPRTIRYQIKRKARLDAAALLEHRAITIRRKADQEISALTPHAPGPKAIEDRCEIYVTELLSLASYLKGNHE